MVAVKEKNVLSVDLNSTTKVFDAKKKTALNLGDYSDYELSTYDGKTITLKKDGEDDITITNASGIKYIFSTTAGTYTDIVSMGIIDYKGVINPNKKNTVTGSKFNDTLDYSGYQKGLTINGGKGNDTIIGTNFADKITGGAGSNIIKYTSLAQINSDTVTLTKGENLSIDISEIEGAEASYQVSGKNLIVSVTDGISTSNFTIMNFGTKDVANTSIELVTEDETINLRNVDVKADTGTWHNDIIDKSNYPNTKNKGLTLDGKTGDDKITGTKYNDTITGGKGNDTINAGLGNNSLKFTKGDGNDVIENGNGVDTLVFAKNTALNYNYDNNDLIISYGNNDTITLKDYLTGHSVQYVKVGSITTSINEFAPIPEPTVAPTVAPAPTAEPIIEPVDDETNGLHIIGTNGDDVLTGTDYDDIIHGKLGADKIYGYGGNDYLESFIDGYICGGDGDDYLTTTYGFSKLYGDGGNDEIVTSGSHNEIYGGADNDKITVNSNFNKIYGGNNDGNPSGNDIINLSSSYNEIYTEDGDNFVNVTYGFNNLIKFGNGNNILSIFNSNGNLYNNEFILGSDNDIINIEDKIYKSSTEEKGVSAYIWNSSIGQSYNNKVYAGKGNDIFNLDEVSNEYLKENQVQWSLFGEEGDDIYNITYFSTNNIIISDNEGNDSLIMYGKNSLYINVNANGTYYKDLYIYNNYNDKLTVKNYMSEGKIETIQSSNGYRIDDTEFDTIIQDVAGWLTTNNYASVQAVIDSGNAMDINAVTAYFNAAWVKA